MTGKMDKAVFTTVEVLWSSYKADLVPGKIEKVIFITVEML